MKTIPALKSCENQMKKKNPKRNKKKQKIHVRHNTVPITVPTKCKPFHFHGYIFV